jgi:hypothetical protein
MVLLRLKIQFHMYKVKTGETIGDICLNGCGSITAWNDILELNSFDDWTPDLMPGQELEIPSIVDSNIQTTLLTYPVNNNTGIPNVETLLTEFINSLIINPDSGFPYKLPFKFESQATTEEYVASGITTEFINYYTIKTGETIGDVCINSTGTIDNWDLILEANSFDDWTPDFLPGQKLIIPSTVQIQNNVLLASTNYPVNNNPDVVNFDSLVDDFIVNFGKAWILDTGKWDDTAYWIDTKNWIDG